MSDLKKLVWWEKTVEYQFVLDASRENRLVFAPLAGNHEKAGDTIVRHAEKFIIIEFKRDLESIPSENKKYKLALDEIRKNHKEDVGLDWHHFIIYGEADSNLARKLNLKYRTYFSENYVDTIKGLISAGVDYDTFAIYLAQLTLLKKSSQGSAGGGLTIDQYALVAGIKNDQIIGTCTLADFNLELDLKLELNNSDLTTTNLEASDMNTPSM